MMNARDELIDVIAETLADNFCTHIGPWDEQRDGCSECLARADAVLAALVSAYGEPEIEGRKWWQFGALSEPEHQHRLVFPWQAVQTGDNQ